MLLRIWQAIRCFFTILFYGRIARDDKQPDYREELARARMRNRASQKKLSHTMNNLLQNLEYDRIVHNDGVIPLDRKKR